MLNGKTILVTGGTGSFGHHFVDYVLAHYQPKKIIIYSRDEYKQFVMANEYREHADVLRFFIGDVRDKYRLHRAMQGVDYVIHAAALKQVPACEYNPNEAIKTNINGAMNVINSCLDEHVKKVVALSTDKAVNPTNVMGATKRVCEMITQTYSLAGRVKYSATRFGNVLGSAGSVIPLFKRQISAGGPVTVTDKRIVRYFMTIPEASQLVLQSGAMAENGELFVLDMGKPVKIWDLARNMVEMSGVSGIDIVEVGLRPGEKLYEELLVKSDTLEKTDNDMIFIEREEGISMKQLRRKLDILDDACNTGSDEAVRAALKQVVPTFVSPEEVNSAAV